jgi:hypothetical protein
VDNRLNLKETEVRFMSGTNTTEAQQFIRDWHYSHLVPSGQNIFVGWFAGSGMSDLFSDGLYAVANFGIGVNPYQAGFLARESGCDVTNDNMVELKRLCRVEPKDDALPLTHFLSRCHKLLKKEGYKYVVSFSDPDHGHNGGIYKASNYEHLGTTVAEQHIVDKDGKPFHRRRYHHEARARGVSYTEARDILQVTTVKTAKKDRWFYKL